MSALDWFSIVVIILCLLLSFFFAGSETALMAFSRARMLRLEKKGNRSAGIVNRLLESRERLIGALLLGNNAVNIAASSLATSLFLLWFGLGIWSKVALGVTLVFFVVFFNVFQGVREVSPTVLSNTRMLGANSRQLLRHVYLPSATSWVFSSFMMATSSACTEKVFASSPAIRSALCGFIPSASNSVASCEKASTGVAMCSPVEQKS